MIVMIRKEMNFLRCNVPYSPHAINLPVPLIYGSHANSSCFNSIGANRLLSVVFFCRVIVLIADETGVTFSRL